MGPADAASPDYLDGRDFRTLLSRHVAIPIGFGLVTVVFFIAVIYYLLALSRWVDATSEAISTTHRVLNMVISHETAVRGYVITGKEEFLVPVRETERDIAPLLTQLRKQVGGERQLNRIDEIEQTYRQWQAWVAEGKRRQLAGEPMADYVGSGGGKRLTDRIRQLGRDLIAEEELERDSRNRKAVLLVMLLSGGYLAVSLLFSGLMAYWGRRKLQELATTYTQLIREQAQHTRGLERHAWVQDGLSEMTDGFVGRDTVAELGESVLGFLARHLDSSVGALYIGSERNTFDRIATYGFSRELAAIEQSFEPGEGLVGQAAVEQRMLHLRRLDTSYIKVSSGLGEGVPVQLLVAPLVSEKIVIGVLELGFLRPLSPRDLEFIELAAPPIAAALRAARYRARLRGTIARVQALNDELQAQQGELQIANAELEEQSEALGEAKERLEEQQAELERANERLAEQNELVRDKNAALERSQAQLRDHALQLEQASLYKSKFLANMSHELRTPLNSSLILAKLLADNDSGNLTPEQVKFAESIHAAGSELLLLINDVLDIAKVEAGKLEVVPDQVSLPRLLDGLLTGFTASAAQKGLSLSCERDDDLPVTLRTDRHRLEQILRNLLSNAIKFTERGGVVLRVSCLDNERIRFAVIDTGPGIAANQRHRIFEPFYQTDSSTSRRYGGTGLGLSISRQLAGLLGGHLDVVSAVGEGSTFLLDIPVAMADDDLPSAEPPTEPEVQLRPPAQPLPADDRERLEAGRKTLLVIEDEHTFAQILYDLAREQGYQCLLAGSAEEGTELALQYRPDAVLLDMKLPDHSGMTVLATLKEEPQTRHIPVHVISVEERQMPALNMGAVGYLVKPVTREQLSDMLRGIEQRISQKMKRVLIVESAGSGNSPTRELITDEDIEVTSVERGVEALALLREKVFDCLIIDLDLADMSGEALLGEMARAESVAFPPVIVHASREPEPEEEQRLARYSRSIIVKSARSPERLLDEVTLFLHKVESELSAERRDLLRLARSRDRTLEMRKILVVDDDVRNIFAITSALESRGARVEIGRNGLDAIERLNAVPDIDLVLMDIMMPEMDGYEAMKQIRSDERFARLPIIAVTARAMRDDQERCLRAGANDYIAKPVDLDRLISLVRVWMPRRARH
jgi:signal transduction histidine kinase/CheY-like chemotaxis protein/CHASE3 domain sensor protein